MLRRDTYQKPLLASAENDLVKILTGERVRQDNAFAANRGGAAGRRKTNALH